MSLANRTVIVTGAGQGIGRGVAEAYAQEGASVVLAELNEETGRSAAEAIRRAGAVPYSCHVMYGRKRISFG